jgi:CRISPR type III-associated protein (TIGR04423 family)
MSNIYKTYSDVNLIPKKQYVGYLWNSNEDFPTIINDDNQNISLDQHPFVVEGNLYYKSNDGNEEISISIRFRDGQYFIYEFDLTLAHQMKVKIERTEYLAHKTKLDGKSIPYYIMFEAWEKEDSEATKKENDPLCGMPTLKPTWAAFGGFINKDQ